MASTLFHDRLSLFARVTVVTLCAFIGPQSMALDVVPMWDFGRPEMSEQRFRDALKTASGDDALILQTQIARTYGLRGQFVAARELLKTIEPEVARAGPEARVRYDLELGRTYASAKHAREAQTPEALEHARSAYTRALSRARTAQLDALAIDAIHMFAFIDTDAADQLKWAQQALSVVESSSQPDAKRWEASIRNNLGYALHQLGRYDEALAQFETALAIRERGTNGEATRGARWMVAWNLRSMGRKDEALAIQLRLEREADAADAPDPEVFDELETLYRERGDLERAKHYRARKEAIAVAR